MKNKKLIGGIFFFTAIAGLVGFGINFILKQKKAIENFCYEFTGWKPLSINGSNIQFKGLLNIKNPTDINLLITGYYFDIYVNNNIVAKVFSSKEQNLYPNKITTLDVFIDVIKNKIPGLLPAFVSGLFSDDTISIKGSVSIKKYIILEKQIFETMKISDIFKMKNEPTVKCA
tara:strand:+ start:609 stop:1127 length:519 start_codon:yes stop_codon:yes gene_type:complete